MKKGKKKQLTDTEKLEKRLRWFSNSSLPHTRDYLIKNLKQDPEFTTSKGILLKSDFIEQYYISREKNNMPTFNYDFFEIPEDSRAAVFGLDDNGEYIIENKHE